MKQFEHRYGDPGTEGQLRCGPNSGTEQLEFQWVIRSILRDLVISQTSTSIDPHGMNTIGVKDNEWTRAETQL